MVVFIEGVNFMKVVVYSYILTYILRCTEVGADTDAFYDIVC